ncbi:methyltransferase domain-containing protein [Pseudonocardiaceae bacterium YIM PH 21723]|nr:methyltransferase domain-containing protein [Pseudonocardiaceae bacterium YIM PH 21723]
MAAHPDDETLGASGCAQALHAAGCAVSVVVATDGEAAFPESTAAERQELARQRRRELIDALAAQGLGECPVTWLGLPDSGLAEHHDDLVARLTPLLADADCCLLPWPDDPHPDHQAAGRAALEAAPITAHRWSFPIWMWLWTRLDDPVIPWDQAHRRQLSPTQRDRKALAIGSYVSQVNPGPHGEEPILTATTLEAFRGPDEVLFHHPRQRTAPVERFASLYAADTDPWQVGGSWYERRKRAITLASLPRQRYRHGLEPACGLGLLTAELADRCDRLTAFDPVSAAVHATRQRVNAHVAVAQGGLPHDIPAEPVDLVVLSEILYYLSDEDLDLTIRRLLDAVEPGGDLVVVHWRPWAPEATRDGETTHALLADRPELDVLVDHRDEHFVLHVLRRR